MNPFVASTVWLSGHRPTLGPNEQPEDFGGLAKIGAAVFVSTLLCVGNSSLAAWTFAASLDPALRVAATLAAAFFGALLVLIVDRAAVYFADTVLDMSRAALGLFLAVRVVLILCLGFFSGQALMPLMLGPELASMALVLREEKDAARHVRLEHRHDVGGRQAALTTELERVERAEQRVATLPADITRQLAAARECWVAHAQARRDRIAHGRSEAEAAADLADRAAACRSRTRAAEVARDAYQQDARRALESARAAAAEMASGLKVAREQVQAGLSAAASIEAEAVTGRSAEVLRELLMRDIAARIKWATLTLLQLLLELLPILLKFNAGQSTVGAGIAARRAVRLAQLARDRSKAEHEDAVEEAMQAASLDAAERLGNSARGRDILTDEYARILHALAPLEGMSAFMRGVDAQQQEVDAFTRRYPQHAARTAETWTEALQRAVASMTAGMRATPSRAR